MLFLTYDRHSFLYQTQQLSNLNFNNLRVGKGPKVSSIKAGTHAHPRELGYAPPLKLWETLYASLEQGENGIDNTVIFTVDTFLWGNDQFKVKYDDDDNGKVCTISARESNDAGDWINNLSVWTSEIDDSCYLKTVSYKHWFWKKWGWVWKYTYQVKYRSEKLCDKGVAGFVEPFNQVAERIESAVKTTCRDATKLQYAGYSRGGALAQIMALHHMRNGLFVNVDTVSLVLFNAPPRPHIVVVRCSSSTS